MPWSCHLSGGGERGYLYLSLPNIIRKYTRSFTICTVHVTLFEWWMGWQYVGTLSVSVLCMYYFIYSSFIYTSAKFVLPISKAHSMQDVSWKIFEKETTSRPMHKLWDNSETCNLNCLGLEWIMCSIRVMRMQWWNLRFCNM